MGNYVSDQGGELRERRPLQLGNYVSADSQSDWFDMPLVDVAAFEAGADADHGDESGRNAAAGADAGRPPSGGGGRL